MIIWRFNGFLPIDRRLNEEIVPRDFGFIQSSTDAQADKVFSVILLRLSCSVNTLKTREYFLVNYVRCFLLLPSSAVGKSGDGLFTM